MNKKEREILKLFVNNYFNIDEISIQLNISDEEVIKTLDKYQDIINKNVLII